MFPLDYVLAVAVLTAPPSSGDTARMSEHACVARTIKEVSLHWEILDPRESFCGKLTDFAPDLDLVRKRLQELADAPRASDALRFPHRDSAGEMLTFNREYHRTLKQRRDAIGGPDDELDQALKEVDQLYHVWDLVRDARSECYYISARRLALVELRRTLGDDKYYCGVLPPHVPIWRFDRRD